MDAVKYLKEKQRMCKVNVHCYTCPLNNCVEYEKKPEQAVETVEKWLKENPQKTILQDFLEKYPNVQLNGYGCPSFCPSLLGYDRNKSCLPDEMRCLACWNRTLEG